MSNREYYHIRKTKKFNKWVKRKLGGVSDNQESSKVTDVDTFAKYVQGQDIAGQWKFYSTDQYKNRKFTQYQAGQVAIREVVNRIVGKGHEKVIAVIGMYGKSTAPGHPAVPNQAWRKTIGNYTRCKYYIHEYIIRRMWVVRFGIEM